MNKENQFGLNISFKNNHSGEEVPFINISNSKSNSSKNQNSKNSSNKQNKLFFLHNNSSSNSHKNNQNLSFSLITFTENSLINMYDQSFNQLSSNKSKSEDQKEIKTEIDNSKRVEIQTPPKKKQNSDDSSLVKSQKNKKAVLSIENIHGKNLMDYFQNIYVKVIEEQKDKSRTASVENIPSNTLQLEKGIKKTNKSWNKKNSINVTMTQKNKNLENTNKNIINYKNNKNDKGFFSEIIKIPKSQKRSSSNIKNSSINNEYLESLLSRYMNIPIQKKIMKKNNPIINNYLNNKNIFKTNKKPNLNKNKVTPKSDSYNDRLSLSHLKIRESAQKKLFHEFMPKQNNEVNLINNNNKNTYNHRVLSTKVIKKPNSKITSNIFDKIINNKNMIKIKQIRPNNNENKRNIKKINNCNEINSLFFKFKEKMNLQKSNTKFAQSINLGLGNRNKNAKK